MKLFKLLGVLLICIVGVAAVLSLVLPASRKIERSVTVNAPAQVIFEQLVKLESFNQWSVWNTQDSSLKNTINGIDGTVGASSNWHGDPEISGEGKIEITDIEENKKVVHSIEFISPQKRKAMSEFFLNENNGGTTITWNFSIATPRPWNIFNLFYSADEEMGKDFEDGLTALKKIIEKTTGTETKKIYVPEPMNFPATSFAIIRQRVKWSDISSFYSQHIAILYAEAGKMNISAGSASGLYYEWDEKNQVTDMAVALPVPPDTRIDYPIISIVNIPASKAIVVNHRGSYDDLVDVHNNIDEYLKKNKLKQKSPVIEQYFSGPVSENDTSKWLTKIVYPVE